MMHDFLCKSPTEWNKYLAHNCNYVFNVNDFFYIKLIILLQTAYSLREHNHFVAYRKPLINSNWCIYKNIVNIINWGKKRQNPKYLSV